MKVVLLAGGFGTRMSDYTKNIPKPMIKVAGKPVIVHIMKQYAKYGYKEFYIALGYKGEKIKKFFSKKFFDWKIHLIETGKNTMTGGRLKKMKKYIGKETFMLTYGDGLSNVNLEKLLKFHKKNNKLVTLTAVRPPARFGSLKLKGNNVNLFKEKSKTIFANNSLTIEFREPFKPRRGRINCSLNDDGKWRWFGVQFPIKEN